MSEPTSRSPGPPRREADPPSLSRPPAAEGLLEQWLERLYDSVSELARGQRELHARVGALTERMESTVASDTEAGSTMAGMPSAEGFGALDDASPGLLYRTGKAGVGLLRRVRHGLVAVKNSSRPQVSVLRDPLDLSPETLRLALILETSDAETLDGAMPVPVAAMCAWRLPELQEVVLWHRPSGSFRLFDAAAKAQTSKPPTSGRASSFATLMAASDTEVCAAIGVDEIRDWSPGELTAALSALSLEELKFVELVRPNRRLLIGRWSWLSGLRTLDASRFDDKAAVVGRSLVLEGSSALPPMPPGADATRLRLIGTSWIAGMKTPRPLRHARRLGIGPVAPKEPEPPITAVVLTRTLDGGLERLVAALATAQPSAAPLRILQLVDEGPEPAHPVLSLSAVTPWVVPLHAGHDADDRAAAALRMLAAHSVQRLLVIGSGRHFFDHRLVHERLQAMDCVLHLPTHDLDGEPPPSVPDSVRTVSLITHDVSSSQERREDPELKLGIDLGPALGTLPDRHAARRHLGLPPDAVVVAHLGDLGFDQQPRDVVRMAQHLDHRDDIHVILAGRGPLAGSVDDLIAFHRLQRCHRTHAHVADVLAAADLVVSAAERHLIPWELVEALRHGVPVVTADARLAPWLLDSLAGAGGRLADVAPGEDPAPRLAEIVLDLADQPEARRQLGDSGPRLVAALPGQPIAQLWSTSRDAAKD